MQPARVYSDTTAGTTVQWQQVNQVNPINALAEDDSSIGRLRNVYPGDPLGYKNGDGTITDNWNTQTEHSALAQHGGSPTPDSAFGYGTLRL